MKKEHIQRAASVICFLLLFACLFTWINDTLIIKRTDGITTAKGLYAQPRNTVDVLVLGSSHAGMNLDAAYMYTEYGIASYVMWGSVQPFWNSYFFLEEALKYQTPQVIVLEVYAATFGFEYSDDARQITNVCGLRFSKNKWEAIQASAPKENRKNLLLGLPLWHSRYTELDKTDFSYYCGSSAARIEKGTSFRYGTQVECQLVDVGRITECAPLHEKEETYLRKIIERCKQADIPLVLLKTTTVNRQAQQPYYNTVAQIAAEQEIPFLNYNLMDAEVGITADDIWEGEHMNTNGARKSSGYLASYLQSHYGLPDRRGDKRYRSWQEFAETAPD